MYLVSCNCTEFAPNYSLTFLLVSLRLARTKPTLVDSIYTKRLMIFDLFLSCVFLSLSLSPLFPFISLILCVCVIFFNLFDFFSFFLGELANLV